MEEGSEVPCYICGEEVVVGDDYRIHVTIAHEVEYDKELILGVVGSSVSEGTGLEIEITLAEESEAKICGNNDDVSKLENIHIERENYNENSSMNSFFDMFDEKLKQIRDLADGKIKPMSVDDSQFEQVNEDQIWQMFENVKSKVMNMEIPKEINNIPEMRSQAEKLMPKISQGETLNSAGNNVLQPIKSKAGKLAPKKSQLENLIPKGIQIQRIPNHEYKPQPIRSNGEKLQPIRSQVYHTKTDPSVKLRSVKSQNPKLQQLSDQVIPDVKQKYGSITLGDLMPPPSSKKIIKDLTAISPPTGNTNDPPEVKQEVVAAPRPQSLYYCPIPDCSFYTTKEGMKTSQAALHLKNDHKIKAKDMKPGMYKFSKIKV